MKIQSISSGKARRALWAAFVLATSIYSPVFADEIGSQTLPPLPPPPTSQPPVISQELGSFTWTQLPMDLPPSVQVFAGDAVNVDGQPVKAWYALIDYSDTGVQAKASVSQGQPGREWTSVLSQKAGALVTINGGYFTLRGQAVTLNTVISGGRVLAQNPAQRTRTGQPPQPIMRSVWGVRAGRRVVEEVFEAKWVAHLNGQVIAYPSPLPNTAKTDSRPPDLGFPKGGQIWDVQEAIGGGPGLISNGRINITATQEGFGGDVLSKRHPRTAVGSYVRNKKPYLVLFVVDGRQPEHSMGQTLPELAQTMKDLGCTQAINLDGGGSSTFVVKDQVLNTPSDGRERSVTSVFSVVPTPVLAASK